MKSSLTSMSKWIHKTDQLLFFSCVILLLSNTSCVNKIDDDEEVLPDITEDNSSLTITTRTGSIDEVVSYPVHFFVFSSAANKCIGKQVLKDAEDNVSFTLPAGSYKVLALAGATEESYNLPTVETATPESIISLKGGASHADLMASTSNVTLTEGEDNTTNIALKLEKQADGTTWSAP